MLCRNPYLTLYFSLRQLEALEPLYYSKPIVAIFNKRIFQFRGYFGSIQRINFGSIRYFLVQLPIFHSTLFQFRVHFSSIQRINFGSIQRINFGSIQRINFGSIQRINFGSIRYFFGSTSDFSFNTFCIQYTLVTFNAIASV